MITGDNPITASNIGYQSFILDSHSKTLIVDENESGFSEEEF
jgi:magnesium-transporting ATPase (P-type)